MFAFPANLAQNWLHVGAPTLKSAETGSRGKRSGPGATGEGG